MPSGRGGGGGDHKYRCQLGKQGKEARGKEIVKPIQEKKKRKEKKKKKEKEKERREKKNKKGENLREKKCGRGQIHLIKREGQRWHTK